MRDREENYGDQQKPRKQMQIYRVRIKENKKRRENEEGAEKL